MNYFKNAAGRWNDWPCAKKESFICMRPKSAATKPITSCPTGSINDKSKCSSYGNDCCAPN